MKHKNIFTGGKITGKCRCVICKQLFEDSWAQTQVGVKMLHVCKPCGVEAGFNELNTVPIEDVTY